MHWDLFLGCARAKSGLWIRRTLLFDDEAHSTAVGGIFETLSSRLKPPPQVCPTDATDCSHLFCLFEALSSSPAQHRLMGEQQ